MVPVPSKSLTLRVTTVRPWMRAVAPDSTLRLMHEINPELINWRFYKVAVVHTLIL